MNKRQARTLNAIRRSVLVLDAKSEPTTPELSHLRERLRATAEAIEQAEIDQGIVGRELLGAARRQVEEIREKHMLPLARLTRRIFVGEPGVLAALRVPHKRAPADEIVAASERMTKSLQPHHAFLTESSIDSRRVGVLRQETRAAKKLLAASSSRAPHRALATRRLPKLIATARADLDAINAIMIASRSQEEAAALRSASRVGKRVGRPRKPRGAASGEARAGED